MKVKINQNIFNVKTLSDKKSQVLGMQKKRFSSTSDGLLFLMDGKVQCFWMKDCIIPLDIIMIEKNVIKKIHHNCPPCVQKSCPTYCGEGNIVLEITGGLCEKLSIKEGDKLEYIF